MSTPIFLIFDSGSLSEYNLGMHNWPTKRKYNDRRPDTVYILSSELTDDEGRRLYKFGVTRWDLGDKRLAALRVQAHNYGLEYVKKVKTISRARDVEKELLKLGEKAKGRGFIGCTEFRWLTELELLRAIDLVSRAGVEVFEQHKPEPKPKRIFTIGGLS